MGRKRKVIARYDKVSGGLDWEFGMGAKRSVYRGLGLGIWYRDHELC